MKFRGRLSWRPFHFKPIVRCRLLAQSRHGYAADLMSAFGGTADIDQPLLTKRLRYPAIAPLSSLLVTTFGAWRASWGAGNRVRTATFTAGENAAYKPK
jgi:hypothetical protein